MCDEYLTVLIVDHKDTTCTLNSSKIIIPIGFYCKNLEHLSFYNFCCIDRTAFSFLLECASTRLVSFHLKNRIGGKAVMLFSSVEIKKFERQYSVNTYGRLAEM